VTGLIANTIGIQEEVWSSQEASEIDYTVFGSDIGKDRAKKKGPEMQMYGTGYCSLPRNHYDV
jgi:hypothetical protein